MAFGNVDIKNNVFIDMDVPIDFDSDDNIDDVQIINNSLYNNVNGIKLTSSHSVTNSKIVNNALDGNSGTTGITTQNHNSGAVDYNDVYDFSTLRSLNGSLIRFFPSRYKISNTLISIGSCFTNFSISYFLLILCDMF